MNVAFNSIKILNINEYEANNIKTLKQIKKQR